jgi:hypothetical protein
MTRYILTIGEEDNPTITLQFEGREENGPIAVWPTNETIETLEGTVGGLIFDLYSEMK